MFTGMVVFFDPCAEEVVELFRGGDVLKVADEELITNSAEEAFDFSFCGTIPNRCMNENGADAAAC